jgi:lipopolysaccharide export system permease protein
MKILDKYIIKTIFFSILFVAVAWVLIFSLFDFLSDSKNIGINKYSFLDSIYVLLLNAPLLIYKRLIVIMLIGTILALGNLAGTSQLIVARSVGVSIGKIAVVVIAFILFLYTVIASFGELVAPQLAEYAQQYKTKQLGKTETQSFQQHIWIKDNDLVVHMGKNYDGENFADITVFNIQNNTLQDTTWAKRMHIDNNSATLGGVHTHHIKGDTVIFTQTATATLPLVFDNTLLETLKKDPLDISIVDIYTQVAFLSANGLKSGIFQIELYKRLLKPFILITTILFAMLFIFGSMRNATMGKKLFLGIAISLVLELYLRISGALVLKFEYNYFLVVALPIIIFFLINIRLLSLKK